MIPLLILIGGLALVFLTEYDTFGWVLVALAVGLFVLQLLLLTVFAAIFAGKTRSGRRF